MNQCLVSVCLSISLFLVRANSHARTRERGGKKKKKKKEDNDMHACHPQPSVSCCLGKTRQPPTKDFKRHAARQLARLDARTAPLRSGQPASSVLVCLTRRKRMSECAAAPRTTGGRCDEARRNRRDGWSGGWTFVSTRHLRILWGIKCREGGGGRRTATAKEGQMYSKQVTKLCA
ncbi:hypothetical protein IWZ03DRAFT_47636 [Phyllosticta citriasiana]|uniref:Secreted protein n=1 Tax=Phyllosticta citriasiana TaxID=595635 RepID=A0ABR1KH00_9PEZI